MASSPGGCTRTPESLYGFDRNGCTKTSGAVIWPGRRPGHDRTTSISEQTSTSRGCASLDSARLTTHRCCVWGRMVNWPRGSNVVARFRWRKSARGCVEFRDRAERPSPTNTSARSQGCASTRATSGRSSCRRDMAHRGRPRHHKWSGRGRRVRHCGPHRFGAAGEESGAERLVDRCTIRIRAGDVLRTFVLAAHVGDDDRLRLARRP